MNSPTGQVQVESVFTYSIGVEESIFTYRTGSRIGVGGVYIYLQDRLEDSFLL